MKLILYRATIDDKDKLNPVSSELKFSPAYLASNHFAPHNLECGDNKIHQLH